VLVQRLHIEFTVSSGEHGHARQHDNSRLRLNQPESCSGAGTGADAARGAVRQGWRLVRDDPDGGAQSLAAEVRRQRLRMPPEALVFREAASGLFDERGCVVTVETWCWPGRHRASRSVVVKNSLSVRKASVEAT
jgi:hypothetical protein